MFDKSRQPEPEDHASRNGEELDEFEGGKFKGLQTPQARLAASRPFIPRFVVNDREVARFYAHTMQPRAWDESCPIGVPSIESIMFRRMTILFYLIDNTVEIIEEKNENAG